MQELNGAKPGYTMENKSVDIITPSVSCWLCIYEPQGLFHFFVGGGGGVHET